MKNMSFTLPLFLALAAIGCHGQVPATQHSYATPTWTLPVPVAGSSWLGCTTAKPCFFQIWKESVATATSPCDPSTSANWKLAFTTAANATSWQDSASSVGGFYCYLAVTTQTSAPNSDPSNTAFANVPPNPLAPAVSVGVTQAANEMPESPAPTLKSPVEIVASNIPPIQLRVLIQHAH